jgi:hypothetical protein
VALADPSIATNGTDSGYRAADRDREGIIIYRSNIVNIAQASSTSLKHRHHRSSSTSSPSLIVNIVSIARRQRRLLHSPSSRSPSFIVSDVPHQDIGGPRTFREMIPNEV